MTDMFGEKVTEEDFFGQYVIIYFGFTFCPEICPKELGKLTEAMNKLGSFNNYIRAVFILSNLNNGIMPILAA